VESESLIENNNLKIGDNGNYTIQINEFSEQQNVNKLINQSNI
jgi:septal ring-binding cell division protein DamX